MPFPAAELVLEEGAKGAVPSHPAVRCPHTHKKMSKAPPPWAGHCSWALKVIRTAPATMTYLETQAWAHAGASVSPSSDREQSTLPPPTSWSCFYDTDKSTLSLGKKMTQKPKLLVTEAQL